MIPEEVIAEIRDRADIVEILSAHVTLKRSGKTFRGPCPLHGGEGPNFSVDPVRQVFKCFVCGEGGSVFTFLMKYLGLTYPEAIHHVAAHVGFQIPSSAPQTVRRTAGASPSIESTTALGSVGTSEESELKKLEQQYNEYLQTHRAEVLERASEIRGKPTNLHTFHGIIGSQYRSYADVVHAQFSDPQDFVARWLAGLRSAAEKERNDELATYGRVYAGRKANRLVALLRDDAIVKYVQNFHERNFYRYLDERIRAKPNEKLWSVWFGDNRMTWGLLIAPVLRGGEWKNDVSEIRRTNYMYWTVGHALEAGFVNPSENRPHQLPNLSALIQFYRNVLKRISVSAYEQAIIDHYTDYLASSSYPENEPLLIPEIRYAGLQRKHEYRLDFSILNSHTMSFTGFELSPYSTHFAVTGTAGRTQIDINNEVRGNWEKEIAKRQGYFDTLGIRIETFTDSHLGDMQQCFKRMEQYLSERPVEPTSIDRELQKLREFSFV
jgi:hypothetical protein